MSNITKKNYNIQYKYNWTESKSFPEDSEDYCETLEEAIERAKKELAEEGHDLIVIAKKVAVVRDANKDVEPNIVVEKVDD